jgi:hypothetical protein
MIRVFCENKIDNGERNNLSPIKIIRYIESCSDSFIVCKDEIIGNYLDEIMAKSSYCKNFFYNTSIDIYIIIDNIVSLYSEKLCEGFAYKSDEKYHLVISRNSDYLHVIGHEISHVIVNELVNPKLHISGDDLEKIVDDIQCLFLEGNVLKNEAQIIKYIEKFQENYKENAW